MLASVTNLTCSLCGDTADVIPVRDHRLRWTTECRESIACWWRWDVQHGLTVMSLEEYREFYANALKGQVTA